MARGVELGQRAAPRGRPRHGPVVARGAQCSVCAARPRRVRDPFAMRQRGRARACSRGARCFGVARCALGTTRSALPRSRRARLPPRRARLPPV